MLQNAEKRKCYKISRKKNDTKSLGWKMIQKTKNKNDTKNQEAKLIQNFLLHIQEAENGLAKSI